MFSPIYKCVIQPLSYVIIFFYTYQLYGKILSCQCRCLVLEKDSMWNVVVHVFIVSMETTCQKKKSNKETEKRYLCCCFFSSHVLLVELLTQRHLLLWCPKFIFISNGIIICKVLFNMYDLCAIYIKRIFNTMAHKLS